MPAWLAVTEQVPTLIKVRVEPEMVQIAGVVVAKLTESWLEEDALKAKVAADKAIEVGASKVMVCRVLIILMLFFTSLAGP